MSNCGSVSVTQNILGIRSSTVVKKQYHRIKMIPV
jgi:hypothetical protein